MPLEGLPVLDGFCQFVHCERFEGYRPEAAGLYSTGQRFLNVSRIKHDRETVPEYL